MGIEDEKDTTNGCADVSERNAAPSALASSVDVLSPTPTGDTLALRQQVTEAVEAWLKRSTSLETRKGYATDLVQFLDYLRVPADALDQLLAVRPGAVSGWRDQLAADGLAANSVRRKLTCLRSLFSFLQNYGYLGANPAHSDFVEAPPVPRDGKTVGLTPTDCRRLLDAPGPRAPIGLRDRAILAILAYSACRVGELVKLRVMDYKAHAGHKVLEVLGKGNKERRIPLHAEAVERLEAWLTVLPATPCEQDFIFPPPRSSRGDGRDGFKKTALSVRAVEYLVERYVRKLGLDPAVTVHSFRVTALTTARERGSDIIDLQDFAGHADPRTTRTYIRQGERLAKSPTYNLKY